MVSTNSNQNSEKTSDFSSIEWLTDQAVKSHKEGQLEEAIAFYLEVIELNFNQPPWIYGNAITLLAITNRLDKGLELGEKARELYPNSDEIYRASAIVLNKKGDITSCINNFHKAIQLNNQQPSWVYAKVTEGLISQNNIVKAIEIGQQGIKIYPEFHWLNYHLTKALGLKQSLNETLFHEQKSKPDSPKENRNKKINHAFNRKTQLSLDIAVFEKFGRILREKQHWQEAVFHYQRAIKHYPKNADFYYYLGEVLVNLRKWEEAMTSYQHGLQLKTNNSHRFVSRLEQLTELKKANLDKIKSHFIYHKGANPSLQKEYKMIKNSGLFNEEYYSIHNPDVTQAKLNLLGHYLERGGLEGRKPSPLFDSSYYITQNKSLVEILINPLSHYLTFGANEGYNPNPLFNTFYYLQNYPDVKKSGLNPLKHYIDFGVLEGRNPHPLFDTSYYLQNYPDVKKSGLNPLQHYLEFGVAEGRDPHPLFDTSYYLESNSDVKKSGLNPLQHYLESDSPHSRHFSPLFSTSNYLENNPDVELLGFNPLLYYLENQDKSLRFLYWPWQSPNFTISSQKGYYNLLVFSHDASRTGGPRVLLAFLKELRKSGNLRDINLWIVIDREGEIEEEFQEWGLTINLSRLVEWSERGYEQILKDLLNSFQEYTGNGTVLINTSAISHINAACHQLRLPVMSWVHELPVTIDTYCGGRESFQKLLDSSRKIVCVSNFVKSSLIKYAQQETQTDKFTTIYASPPTLEESNLLTKRDVDTYKKDIEAEFSFSDNCFIVMGCGTVTPRKGCDVFVQVANHIINKCNIPNVYFLWIGEIYTNEYIRWLKHDIQTLGLEGRVIFASKRNNPSDYMKGADIFVLTSKEDPFPLVNLEAMYYGLPVISFKGGGGAPEIYHGGRRGIAVEYLDVAKMAEAIISLKDNPQRSKEIALEAKKYIQEELNWSNFVSNFMRLIRDDFDYYPQKELKVVVIIPNYNHQKFIEDRIASIVNQTVKPDEIIFLDDNSSDRSAEIATELLSKTDIPYKIIINEQNTGSPFKQWVKGVQESSGDLIWIAESDDSCKLNFIEKIKPQFFDPDVVLAYSQSAPIGENGQVFQDNYRFYTNDICHDRWKTYYKDEGVNEIAQALCLKNTVPNASAVIFRKEALTEDCMEHIRDFRFVGDWLLYISIVKKGKVAFIPNSLNNHRRHSNTVTSKVEKEDKHAQEVLELKRHIFSHSFVAANSISESIGRTIDDYYSLDERHNLGRVAFTKNPSFQTLLSTIRSDLNQKYFSSYSSSPRILFIIGDAKVGGGQIAAIRLANEMAKNYPVFLCNAQPHFWDNDILGLVDSKVVLLEGSLKPTVWSAFNERRINIVRDLIAFYKIDVLFSHIWWADNFTYEVNKDQNLPWFIRMHGCYEELANHPEWDPAFQEQIQPMMRSVSGICYSTKKNLGVFDKLKITPPNHIEQLFNGLDRTKVDNFAPESNLISRGKNDFVFCLCSRAIPEKGWDEAIEATIRINQLTGRERNNKIARLVLIGDSDYAEKLRKEYANIPEILFLGQQQKPTNFFSKCDVGLLPSRFKSESLPSTLVEYLACDLPVITTNIGSIPEMISLDGNEGGLIVSLSEELRIDIKILQEMMLRYMTNEQLYTEHKSNARLIFDSLFDIKILAEDYIKFFEDSKVI